jgi:hypothetical protein
MAEAEGAREIVSPPTVIADPATRVWLPTTTADAEGAREIGTPFTVIADPGASV